MAEKKRSTGRAHRNIEFLRTLRQVLGMTPTGFANACGKPTNMASYTSGNLHPGDKVLKSSLEHLFEWPVSPLMELQPIPSNLNSLSTTSGVYVIYDSAGNVLYIGQAKSFRAEIRQTLSRRIPVPIRFGPTLAKANRQIRTLASHLSLYEVESPRARHNLEALLLRVIPNQTHNSNVGKFK